ncbi:MAG TPA: hypothetical protein PL048_11380 [Leptospiraceae bacterium]|nr:hypothetical protein [Leptospiraceae bacterium]HMY65822.1 hypothetical protein [Leptospiraceae bacterium]HMZ59370.1 hypothetical protein [Leptospiraceae bacterium]HNF16870.1 hypothetical protein [Leptospiraceae bacterium]HNF24887.1 hypothetical protein [Leptospiraceae bacterium]
MQNNETEVLGDGIFSVLHILFLNSSTYLDVKVRIGIHCDRLIPVTIIVNERMNMTVISDAVTLVFTSGLVS